MAECKDGRFPRELITSYITNGKISYENLTSLMDKIREFFDLDMVFLAENRQYLYLLNYTYASTRDTNMDVSSEEILLTEQSYQEFLKLYDEEGLCNKHASACKDKPGKILHYGLMSGDFFYGYIGFRSTKSREWTKAEREVLKELGHVALCYVSLQHRDMEKEKEFIFYMAGIRKNSLCGYYVDLKKGTCHAFKENQYLNDIFSGWSQYDEILKKSCDKYVDSGYAAVVASRFDRNYLKSSMSMKHPKIEVEYPCSLDGNLYWYRLRASLIDVDEENIPYHMTLVIDDISDVINEQEKSYYAYQLIKENYYGIFSVNLNADRYTIIGVSEDSMKDKMMDIGVYTKWIDWVSKKEIHPDFRDAFKKIWNINYMIEKMDASKSTLYMDYKRKIGPRYQWVRAEIIPVKDYAADNRRVTIYIKNITDKKTSEEYNIRLLNALRGIYFSIFDIAVLEDRFYSFEASKKMYGLISDSDSAQKSLNGFIDSMVEEESKDEMRQFLDLSTLQQRMGNKKIISQEYRKIYYGWCRVDLMPVQKTANGKIFRVLLGITSIDETKQQEMEYQNRLQTINKQLLSETQVVKTLVDSYYAVCSLDMENNTYHTINSNNKLRIDLELGNTIQKKCNKLIESCVEKSFQKELMVFCNLDTLTERLQNANHISMEFKEKHVGWCEIKFLVSKRNSEGKVVGILLLIHEIGESKRMQDDLKSLRKELAQEKYVGKELEYRAEHDMLTGLLNRAAFERVRKSVSQCDTPIGFALLDVDNFKSVNDTYGHIIGDKILKKVADLLLEHFTATDFVFRFGGDEFAVIIRNYGKLQGNGVKTVFNTINERLRLADNGLPVASVSVGLYRSEHGYSNEVYKKADEALYYVKEHGRCGCVCYQELENLVPETKISSELYMEKSGELDQLSDDESTLQKTMLGVWKIIINKDGTRGLYGNHAMMILLGITGSITPEKCYEKWVEGIDTSYRKDVFQAAERMIEGEHTEITYPWNHPVYGRLMIRCGGAREELSNKKEVAICGYHQNISELTISKQKNFDLEELDAIAKTFLINITIYLQKGRYHTYHASEDFLKEMGEDGLIANLFRWILEKHVKAFCQKRVKNYFDLYKLEERLQEEGSMDCEYCDKITGEWHQASFIAAKKDIHGNILEVLFYIRKVDFDRQKEIMNFAFNKMQKRIQEVIFQSKVIFLGMIDTLEETISVYECKEIDKMKKNKELPYAKYVQKEQIPYMDFGDKERFIELTGLDYIKTKLNREGYFSFIIKHRNEKNEKIFCSYHFCYYNDEHQSIICTVEDVTKQQLMDEVTGELNLHGFEKKVKHILEKGMADGNYVILHFDIKGFKAVNEMMSFERGNDVLKEIAKILKKSKLCPLAVCRDRADHFYLLINQRNLNLTEIVRLCNAHIIKYDLIVSIHMNCGIYFIDDQTMQVRMMCDRAKLAEACIDNELSTPYYIYNEDISKRYLDRINIIDSLDTALNEKQFQVYYQPIVDAYTEKIVSAEALIRWNHPERGIISPGLFIPVLEEKGHISKVDIYVAKEVYEFQQKRREDGKFQVPISMNLSRVDFYNEEVIHLLELVAKDEKQKLSYLRFEITESGYVDVPEQGKKLLNKLREKGSCVLVDDFGSGYSSLSSLSEQNFDYVKLDMSFVKKIGKNEKTEAVILTIIELAHRMEAKIIAEGVETKEQLEFLKKNHCDFIQGYYFSKPLSEEAFKNKLDHGDLLN